MPLSYAESGIALASSFLPLHPMGNTSLAGVFPSRGNRSPHLGLTASRMMRQWCQAIHFSFVYLTTVFFVEALLFQVVYALSCGTHDPPATRQRCQHIGRVHQKSCILVQVPCSLPRFRRSSARLTISLPSSFSCRQ